MHVRAKSYPTFSNTPKENHPVRVSLAGSMWRRLQEGGMVMVTLWCQGAGTLGRDTASTQMRDGGVCRGCRGEAILRNEAGPGSASPVLPYEEMARTPPRMPPCQHPSGQDQGHLVFQFNPDESQRL
jgi:hypothetical protein